MPVESGFEITPPIDASFRFAETNTYRRLAGAALKEMDYGWFDTTRNELLLVELTNYETSVAPIDRRALMKEMIEKGRDSMLMLQAAWKGVGKGQDLARELPDLCKRLARLRLCFVLRAKRDELDVIVSADVKGRLASVLKIYANLMGMDIEVDLLGPVEAMARLPISVIAAPAGTFPAPT